MIQDLQDRAAFWAEHHRVPCQGDSIEAPFRCFTDWKDLIAGRRVLEIGPGEGRQFKQLASYAGDYTVADIVPLVLENPMYQNAGKRLIASYAADDFGERFDVVCFWYVLHHVLRSEGREFFKFIKRHLAEGGEVIFNAPSATQVQGIAAREGNGVETTPWQPVDVVAMLEEVGLRVVRSQELAHNCYVFHARRPASTTR